MLTSSGATCNVVTDVPEAELGGRRLRVWLKRLRRTPEAVVVRGAGWRDVMLKSWGGGCGGGTEALGSNRMGNWRDFVDVARGVSERGEPLVAILVLISRALLGACS